MVRNELFVRVPSVFRCPISLDVMTSPVSLCTGITYDRSSIQRWLDSGHDTCPATNQQLPTKDFVPNLTLHRLISLWAASSSNPPSPTPCLSPHHLRRLLNSLDHPDSLSAILRFLAHSDDNRRFVVTALDGFVPSISCLLRPNAAQIQSLEIVVNILHFILPQQGVKEQLHDSLFRRGSTPDSISAFILLLRSASPVTRIQSLNLLESAALDAESRLAVVENRDLSALLLDLLSPENDAALNEALLSCLVSMAASRSARPRLADLGIVRVATRLLSEWPVSGSVAERCIRLLSLVGGCSEGRAAICEDSECAAALVQRLMKVSSSATEDTVVVLWGACCVCRDARVQDAVAKNNGLTKILLVMQSNCGAAVKAMCGDLVKLLCSRNGSNRLCLAGYQTNTIHITPC